MNVITELVGNLYKNYINFALFVDNYPQIIISIILSIFIFPVSVIIHELGHCFTITNAIKKIKPTKNFELIANLRIAPNLLSGYTTILDDEELSFISLLEVQKKYKTIIKIYRAGMYAQILWIASLIVVSLRIQDIIPLIYSLPFIITQLFYIIITFLFANRKQKCKRDRYQIKKFKKLNKEHKKQLKELKTY